MKVRHAGVGRVIGFLVVAALGGLARNAAAEPLAGRVGVGTWNTQVEFKDIQVARSGVLLYSSNFSKGLEGWQTQRGRWQVVDGALRQTAEVEDTRAMVGDPTWTDYTLTLKARKLGGREGFLIYFAASDDRPNSRWNIGGWNNTAHAFESPGFPATRVPGRIETGRWYDIRIEVSGNTVRAFIDNQLLQSGTESPSTHTIEFRTDAKGKKVPLTHWGLDTAWPVPDHVRRGMMYMGKENLDIIRVSFPIDQPLVNGELPASKDSHFTDRLEIAKIAGDLPLTMLPDTEKGVHPWYKNGRDVDPQKWAQLIAAAQRKYGKKMQSIEPFNEADYGWGQGPVSNYTAVLAALAKHPDFQGVEFGGPSTLNCDAALRWYEPNKAFLHRGTTHSLGGTFDSYINFFKQVLADGKVADNPEAHNLVEVISGAEYGLQSAIWWETAELARGEFVRAVHGEQLAYAEDRTRWSAAAVYRAPAGHLQGFLGCSERMGEITRYRFVSLDRPVFFNGDGPRREWTFPIRRHGEYVVNITWGADTPRTVSGRHLLVNRKTGQVLTLPAQNADAADLRNLGQTTAKEQQLWEIAPFVAPWGDQSYFTVHTVAGNKPLALSSRTHDEKAKIQLGNGGGPGADHWYFEYAGQNNYYIRNRYSTQCLTPEDGKQTLVQIPKNGGDAQLWRLMPADAGRVEFDAPRPPVELTATPRTKAVELRWTASPDSDVATYTVLRTSQPNGAYEIIARDITSTTFTDTDTTPGTIWHYVVQAVDRCLNTSTNSTSISGAALP